MVLPERFLSRMKTFKWVRATAIAASALALIGFIGGFVLPPILRSQLQKRLGREIGRPVTIQKISINPYSMGATASGFSMLEPDGSSEAFGFDKLYINLEMRSLFRWAPVIREVRLEAPRLHLVRNADKSYNISDLIDRFTRPSTGPPARFSVSNIQIAKGRVDFEDKPTGMNHAVSEINLGIPFLSNMPGKVEVFVQTAFSANVDGKRISLEGKSRPFTDVKDASVELSLNDIDLPKYLDYLPEPLQFQLRSARMDAHVGLSFEMERDKPHTVRLRGTVALREFDSAEEDGEPLVSFPRLDVSILSWKILEGEVGLGSVLLTSPEIHASRSRAGKLNLISLLQSKGKARAKEKPEKKTEARFKYAIGEAKLVGGKIHLRDDADPAPFKTGLREIGLTLKNFGNRPGVQASLEVEMAGDAFSSLRHKATFSLEPPKAEGLIEVDQLRLDLLGPYLKAYTAAEVTGGAADISAHYSADASRSALEFSLSGGKLALASLQVRLPGEKEDAVAVNTATFSDIEFDLGRKALSIGALSGSGGNIAARRERDGSVSLSKLMPATASPEKPGTPGPNFTVILKNAELDGWSIGFEDMAAPQPTSFVAGGVRLIVEDISTEPGSLGRMDINCSLGGHGKLSARGPLSISPFTAKLDLDLKGFAIGTLLPYAAGRLRADVAGGDISCRGRIEFGQSAGGAISAAFDGEAEVAGLRAFDQGASAELLRWDSLHFGTMRVSYNPAKFEAKEISLTDFYASISISPEGRLNLQDLWGALPAGDEAPAAGQAADPAPAQAQESAKAPAEEFPISISAVTLQGGKVHFADHFIKPNYSLTMTGLGGRISDLSSGRDALADVDLRGKMANAAPIHITGKIHPFGGDASADIQGSVKDFELTPLTPYSGKYLGYEIQQGKLSLELKYRLKERKLEADNHIFLDQLTLGDRVESKEATGLPVRLAIALLKNRNGEIDLQLPVTGSLDDPKFKVGPIVWKMILNLIGKAATAPFALLGSLFGGGGEEYSYAEFQYGGADLSDAERGKLDKLAKALLDRPALKLEIAGMADPERDPDGLRRYRLDEKVRSEKLREMSKKELAQISADTVTVTPEEYPNFLESVYKREKFPKPRMAIGLAKKLPSEEMEKLILANSPVGDEDLNDLAMRRAAAVRDALLAGGQIQADRVFLLAPKVQPAAEKGAEPKPKLSRADFTLK